jgi:glutamine synthetase
VRRGFELEWFIGHAGEELSPAHQGPVYSPHAMLAVDEFAAQLLADMAANGISVGQLHAEYGLAQMELSVAAADPVTAADLQMLARQTIHAAARANGLRASFAPLVTMESVGNGWHLHSSVLRDGRNLLAGGDGPSGMTAEGEAYVAGLLRELPALAAVAAPSMPSLLRRRPGYFASAFGWGVQNREAASLTRPERSYDTAANVELKASDASGIRTCRWPPDRRRHVRIEDGLAYQSRSEGQPGRPRSRTARRRLPETTDEQIAAVSGSRPCARRWETWLAPEVRRGDAAAVQDGAQDVVAAHRWRY